MYFVTFCSVTPATLSGAHSVIWPPTKLKTKRDLASHRSASNRLNLAANSVHTVHHQLVRNASLNSAEYTQRIGITYSVAEA